MIPPWGCGAVYPIWWRSANVADNLLISSIARQNSAKSHFFTIFVLPWRKSRHRSCFGHRLVLPNWPTRKEYLVPKNESTYYSRWPSWGSSHQAPQKLPKGDAKLPRSQQLSSRTILDEPCKRFLCSCYRRRFAPADHWCQYNHSLPATLDEGTH